jgi:hypothetical protein
MAYEKEFFHLRWRKKKREKLQGGASAAGGFPDSRRLALVSSFANFGASLSNPLNLFMGMHS